jgi:hypothetical protein
MNDTKPAPFTEHTPVVELVTDVTPSLPVVNNGVNDVPTTGDAGRFEIDTDVTPTITDCPKPCVAA